MDPITSKMHDIPVCEYDNTLIKIRVEDIVMRSLIVKFAETSIDDLLNWFEQHLVITNERYVNMIIDELENAYKEQYEQHNGEGGLELHIAEYISDSTSPFILEYHIVPELPNCVRIDHLETAVTPPLIPDKTYGVLEVFNINNIIIDEELEHAKNIEFAMPLLKNVDEWPWQIQE